MKRLITILVSAVAAVALLVGGTAYAIKPGTTHTTTPTPNVVMESGSGILPVYVSESDNETNTYYSSNTTYFPSTLVPIYGSDNVTVVGFTGTGYDGVVHVSLTFDLKGVGNSLTAHVYVNTLCEDNMNVGPNWISLEPGADGTIEFDAYDTWNITLSLQSGFIPENPPYVSYNYTLTYPAQ